MYTISPALKASRRQSKVFQVANHSISWPKAV